MRDFYRFNSADEDQKIVAQSVGDRLLLALSSPALEVRYDPGGDVNAIAAAVWAAAPALTVGKFIALK